MSSFALWSLMPMFVALGLFIAVAILVTVCFYCEFEARDAAYIAYWEEKRRGASCL